MPEERITGYQESGKRPDFVYATAVTANRN